MCSSVPLPHTAQPQEDTMPVQNLSWSDANTLCLTFDADLDAMQTPDCGAFCVTSWSDPNVVSSLYVYNAAIQGKQLFLTLESDYASWLRTSGESVDVKYISARSAKELAYAGGGAAGDFYEVLSVPQYQVCGGNVFIARSAVTGSDYALSNLLADACARNICVVASNATAVLTLTITASHGAFVSRSGYAVVDPANASTITIHGTQAQITEALQSVFCIDEDFRARAASGTPLLGSFSMELTDGANPSSSDVVHILAEDVPQSSFFLRGGTEYAYINSINGLSNASFSTGSYVHANVIDAEKSAANPNDDDLCWAATASNMLTWAGYGDALPGEGELEDRVFKEFWSNFSNAGGNSSYGVSWFLNGLYDYTGDNGAQPSGGGNVGGNTHPQAMLAADRYVVNAPASRFVDELAAALFAGDAAGVGVASEMGGHAITCWGLTFDAARQKDDPGWLTGFYYTDSDDEKWHDDPTAAGDALHYVRLDWDATREQYELVGYHPTSTYYWDGDFTTLARKDSLKERLGAGGTSLPQNGVVSSGSTCVGGVLGGELHVEDGGWAIATAVGAGATMNVSSGGVTFGATVNAGGQQIVSNGGWASNTMVGEGGRMFVYAGGTATGLDIKSGGGLDMVVAGGQTTSAQGTYRGAGFNYAAANGLVDGVTLHSGLSLIIDNGGSATNTTINAGGSQIISNGGMADFTTVNSGGWQIVSNGGSATNTTVSAGGWLEVWNGGTAFDATVLAGGRFGVFAGGSASGGTVEAGAAFYAGAGATITDVAVSDGALQYVDAGAVVLPGISGQWWAEGDTPQGYTGPLYMRGEQYVYGVVNGEYILGKQYVMNGGQALYCTVGSGGSQVISQGGQARNTTVLAGGDQFVVGGLAHDTSISGGTQHVAGGTASKTIVNANGWQKVHAGTAQNTTVNRGGAIRVDKGGIARATTVVNGGIFSAAAGAVVSGLTLATGARAVIAGGNTLYAANSFTGATVTGSTKARPVKLGSTATLTLGGKNTMTAAHLAPNAGHINITGATNKVASLNLVAKSRITYDVSRLKAAGNTLMLQLSLKNTQKRGVFSISVGKAQTSGVYELSKNITQKKGMAYTVKLGNAKLGTVKLGGATLTKNGATYKLAAKGAQINLTIGTKVGKMLKGTAGANTLKGASHCDIFYGGKGNDKIYGSNGRDVAVYDKVNWGKDIIAKTNGAMTLLFNGLKASDIVQKVSGTSLVITRKGAAGQSITIQGYNAATHKIVFGSGLKAVDKYLAAARPTTAQANAARNQIWKKAGLA